MFSSLNSVQSIIDYTSSSQSTPFALNTTNLLVRYNMDNSGTTILDRSGNTYNGSAPTLLLTTSTIGSSSLGSNMWGLMDGVNKRVITLPQVNSSNRNYSFSFWMYCTAAPIGGDCIWWNMDRNAGSGAPFFFQNRNTNTYSYNLLTTFTLAQNTWYHIVCIDDYSNTNKIVYINGSLHNTTSFSAYTNFFVVNNGFISSGSNIGGSIETAHKPPNGYMADFRIYNRILTSTEITSIYNKLS